MKRTFLTWAIFCAFLLGLGTFNSHAAFKNWTNVLGGNWFDPFGWSPNGVPTSTDTVTITNDGTYTVYAPTGVVASAVFKIGGGSGKQTFVYGTTGSFQFLLTNSFVLNNGVLAITNAGLIGGLTVEPGGELQFNAPSLYLYQLSLTNYGTVSWIKGLLEVGGSGTSITYFTNNGLWQIASDANVTSGGGGVSQFFNSGTVRKTAGIGNTSFNIEFHNLPSGLVDCTSGLLQLSSPTTNILAGAFTATSPGGLRFFGNQTDSGGSASGTGTFQFQGGTFYLRTNPVPGITLTTGGIVITGNTFQNAGAITNLTLDGAGLVGNNQVTGTLNVNSGSIGTTLIVTPSGLLNLAPSSLATPLLYSSTLINQGIVNWGGGGINVGGMVVSNGGTWNITGNANANNGGAGVAVFTNAGLVLKTNSTGTSELLGYNFFVNLPSGIVTVASGILDMPGNYTNTAGELRLAGGTLGVFPGTPGMTGGTLDGTGTISVPAAFDGGTVAPQAAIHFTSSLSLGTNTALMLSGTGTSPGVTYGQLSVAGTLAISNTTLQITSLPSVSVGTTFTIITNTAASSTTGSFNGLAENALLTIGAQQFRVHYSGGNGNDVVLIRDSGVNVETLLSNTGYSNKVYRLTGTGNPSTIYTIQASTNLLQWTNIGYSTGDISGHFNFADTNAVFFRYRMYRATN